MLTLTVRPTYRIAVVGLGLSLLGACATARPGCPVTGDVETVSRLAGEWRGTYTGEDGREGRISFRLDAGSDTARGEVFIAPRTTVTDADANRTATDFHASTLVEIPAIRFIQASGGELEGMLEPYRDPNCGCVIRTTFRGRLKGNVIEGTFASEGSGFFHMPTSGTWRVTRKPE
jgi:hypothetical protein